MKYKIRKQIHSCFAALSSNDVWLYYEFELPFLPYEGLKILGENIEVKINECYWDLEEKEFRLYAESDKQFYDVHNSMKDYSKTDEFRQYLKDEYLDYGWQKLR